MWVLIMALVWPGNSETSITSIRFDTHSGCAKAKVAMENKFKGKYASEVWAVCVEDK